MKLITYKILVVLILIALIPFVFAMNIKKVSEF